MSDAEHAQVHRDVGAYVLGALEPAERDRFERHLAGCGICRDELADLAVLPSLLSRLDGAPPEDAAPASSFAPIEQRLAVERRRTKRRERLLTAVAALMAVSALVVVIAGPPSSSDAGIPFASADGAVTATVESRDWGMAVHIAATDLPDSDGYVAQAVARDGHRTQVASWSDTGGAVRISGACYLEADDVARVEILDAADDEVLVVLDAAGPSQAQVR